MLNINIYPIMGPSVFPSQVIYKNQKKTTYFLTGEI